MDVSAEDVGFVSISGIPDDWEVDSSQNEGAFLGPDGLGDNINDSGEVAWVWDDGQDSVDVSVTFNVPVATTLQDYDLDVEAENTAGYINSDTATVSVVEGVSVTATGDTAPPGGQATVEVSAEKAAAVELRDIPSDWELESSVDDGATFDYDSDDGTATWVWVEDQDSVEVSATFNIPDDAALQSYDLTVEAGDGDTTDTDTATVSVSSDEIFVTATGDTASPGGQATVDVTAGLAGSVTVTDIPQDWEVAESEDDGAFITPGNLGDNVDDQGSVAWVWDEDRSLMDVSVTFDLPDDVEQTDHVLGVEAENADGETADDTAAVEVQDCPFEPIVCEYDEDGDIDTGDLQDAISDFLAGDIDTGDLQAIINAFLAG